MKRETIYPTPLKEGDLIAIVAPATSIKPEYVEGGKRVLESLGFRVAVAPHVSGPADGSYAASQKHRLDDLLAAIQDEEVKAIMCARGGYGCVQLLPYIPEEAVRCNPKWIIGYSDVSALHAFWHHCGVASLHAPMLKHLSVYGAEDFYSRCLLDALTQPGPFHYTLKLNTLSLPGKAEGRLLGGNFAVLDGLAATPFDIFAIGKDEDVILFFEDIAEPIYKIDRMLTRLYLAGTLSKVKGLIFGSFTEYKADNNFPTIEVMIADRLRRWGITSVPVAFGFPTGHTCENIALIEGSRVSMSVAGETGEFIFHKS